MPTYTNQWSDNKDPVDEFFEVAIAILVVIGIAVCLI